MFISRIDTYNLWTLHKPMTSLSTCYLEFVALDGNLDRSCKILLDLEKKELIILLYKAIAKLCLDEYRREQLNTGESN